MGIIVPALWDFVVTIFLCNGWHYWCAALAMMTLNDSLACHGH